jgi:2-methylisoborneol synthase
MTGIIPTAEATPLIDPPPHRDCPVPSGPESALVAAVRAGPSGLGTSAARLVRELTLVSGPGLAYVERPWGDGTAASLYVPVVERVDDALAAEVDDRLVVWAKDCGFTDGEAALMRRAGFGRLAMLTHTDTDDPDRLLIAAQLNAAWWAADDLYADDSEMGATPTELPPRLALVMAAMDPVAPAGEFSVLLDEALRSDPVLVALNSGIEHLTRHASPAQVQRACYATFAMFVSWNSYAAWRFTGDYPPAWKYLAARQHDSFYTSMTLIDAVGGYELDANLYYQPRVRRALMQAGTASVMVNDLHSVAKDAVSTSRCATWCCRSPPIGSARSRRPSRSPSSCTTTWSGISRPPTTACSPCPRRSSSGSYAGCAPGWAAASSGTPPTPVTRADPLAGCNAAYRDQPPVGWPG